MGELSSDRFNALRKLMYYDPEKVLRELRAAELTLTELNNANQLALDPKSLALRTSKLKVYREWRDAALFTYGMGLMCETKMSFASVEKEDYDFVTLMPNHNAPAFMPVQLKELPPADLNPQATLTGLIDSLKKYGTNTETTLVVKLSKRPEIDLTTLRTPNVPFSEVYLFWATAPESAKWILYGNLKVEEQIRAFEYDYPS